MSRYAGRNAQGENMLRVIHFDHPQWVPALVGFLPACGVKYGEALDDLKLAHPRLFPGLRKTEQHEAPVFQEFYVQGKTTDCWGCVWDNLHGGMVGQVVGHPLADWSAFDTWAAHRPDPIKQGILGPRDWEAFAKEVQYKKEIGHFSPDGALAHGFHYMLLCDLRGFENLMMDMATDNPLLYTLIDVLIDYNAKVVAKQLELGCEFLGLAEDLGMQHTLPISPELWRKFVKPGYEATAGQARDREIPVFLHSDGHILPIIPDLIETGIRVLNPQIRANGLQGLKDVAKGKVTICLDLDRQLFPFASPAQLEQHVADVFEALYLPEGGLIINVEIGEDVSLESMDVIFGAVERYCKLPDPETTGGVSVGF